MNTVLIGSLAYAHSTSIDNPKNAFLNDPFNTRTPSVGGALALVVGAAVLTTLLGPGRTLRAAGPPTLGAVVALAGLAPSMPASSLARIS